MSEEIKPNNEELQSREAWNRWQEKRNRNRFAFLDWVKTTYNPQKVYYAGSGYDEVPKEVFGDKRVVHLSLEENKYGLPGGYFSRLKATNKVQGNIIDAPFKPKSFDAIYLHNVDIHSLVAALDEFNQVLKDDGIHVFDNDIWASEQIEYFITAAQDVFVLETIPENLISNETDPTHYAEQSFAIFKKKN